MTIKERVLLFLGATAAFLVVLFFLVRIWQATNLAELTNPGVALVYLVLLLMLVPFVGVIPSALRGLFRSVRGR